MKEFPIYQTLYAQESHRALFLDGTLINQWRALYPFLFDEKDRETALNQRQSHRTHFYEWFTAIQLFHQSGYYSLVEKYEFSHHPEKDPRLEKLADPKAVEFIRNHREYSAQCPDLLVYRRDYSDYFFIEVKGPGDPLVSIP